MSDNGCGCVYTSYDGDTASVDSTVTRRARKEHRCCECRRPIAVGVTYQHTSGLWDGRWQSYKTCFACVEIRQELCCEGWNYTSLWEDIAEYFDQGGNPIGCIVKFESADAKELLAERYREHLGLAEQS